MLPIDALLLPDPLEQGMQELLPDAPALPVPEAAPTGDARAAAHLLGEHLPGDTAAEDKDDARQASAVVHGRPAALAGPGLVPRRERRDGLPEFVGDQRFGHGSTSQPMRL